MTEEEKNKILNNVKNLIEENGCLGDVFFVANSAWLKYKGKQDEMLNAITLIADRIIDKNLAIYLLNNEDKEGNLNLSMFPTFRKEIERIANS